MTSWLTSNSISLARLSFNFFGNVVIGSLALYNCRWAMGDSSSCWLFWQHPSESVAIFFIIIFVHGSNDLCSSICYTDWALLELQSFMRMQSCGMWRFSRKFSDGGAIMMLAPAAILSGWAGPSSPRKILSYSWLLFLYIHQCACGNWGVALDVLRFKWSIPESSWLVLAIVVLVMCVCCWWVMTYLVCFW